VTEPQDITRNPDDSVVPVTWAEGGAVTEPSAGKKDVGWAAADVVDKETINWTNREPMRWLRALYSRYPQASEGLMTSWLVRNGAWSDNGVGALDGFLSDTSGGANVFAADVWANPPDIDTGAVRVQVSVSKASPATFSASRDNYVFVPIDMISPPTVSVAELTITAVSIGDPAPATPAGTVAVWRVETDGSSIVDQEVLVFTIPSFKTIGVTAINTLGNVNVGGDLDVAGNLTVGGTSDFSDAVDVAAMLTVSGDAPAVFTGNVTAGTDAGDAVVINGTTNVNATLSANGNVNLGNNTGDQINVGGGGSDAVAVLAPSTFGQTITMNAVLNALSGINLSAQTIGGTPGSLVDVELLQITEVRWDASGTTLPGAAGRTRWNDTFFALMDGAGQVRTFDEPSRGHDVAFTTSSGIADTTATCGRRIKENEPTIIEVVVSRYENSTAPDTMNFRLSITGPLGTVEPVATSYQVATSGVGYSQNYTFRWTPTDDFGAETTTQNYSALVRLGTSGGTLDADDVAIKWSSAVQV